MYEYTPVTAGPLSLILRYTLELFSGICENSVEIPFTTIAPDPVLQKWDQIAKAFSQITPKRAMAGENISFEMSLPECFDTNIIKIEKVETSDSALSAQYDAENKKICVSGIPQVPGTINMTLHGKLETRSMGVVTKEVDFPVLIATPDPKTLWKNLPTDPTAPYQSPDEDHIIIKA